MVYHEKTWDCLTSEEDMVHKLSRGLGGVRAMRWLLTGCILLVGHGWVCGADDEAVLAVTVDAPCVILVDDELVSRVDPGGAVELPVAAGYRDVAALSLQTKGVIWEEAVRIDDDEPYELEISIADQVVEDDSYRLDSRLEETAPGAVRDPETDLEWTVLDNNFDLDWGSSKRYCETMRLGAGSSGWRLPTLEELESLVDEDSRRDFLVLGKVRLSGCCPWSSEEHGSVSAWYLSFEDGRPGFVTRDFSEGGRALCVR